MGRLPKGCQTCQTVPLTADEIDQLESWHLETEHRADAVDRDGHCLLCRLIEQARLPFEIDPITDDGWMDVSRRRGV